MLQIIKLISVVTTEIELIWIAFKKVLDIDPKVFFLAQTVKDVLDVFL